MLKDHKVRHFEIEHDSCLATKWYSIGDVREWMPLQAFSALSRLTVYPTSFYERTDSDGVSLDERCHHNQRIFNLSRCVYGTNTSI